MKICKKLKTKAKQTVKGRKVKSNAVELILAGKSGHTEEEDDGDDTLQNKWVLHIVDTPGQWYVSTLLGADEGFAACGNELYIDGGQEWLCTNMDAIMKEALALI